jgi:hypothetical protein
VQHYFIPTIRAAIKLRQHDPAAAVDLLRGTAKYDLAFTGLFDYVYPPTSADSHTWTSAMANRPRLSSKS